MSPAVMRKLAKPMLFSAALIWGTSFFIMKNALDNVPVFALLASVFAVCILSGIGFFLCKICRRSKLSHIRH